MNSIQPLTRVYVGSLAPYAEETHLFLQFPFIVYLNFQCKKQKRVK